MTRELWVRIAIAAGAILASSVVAKVIDARMSRRELAPGAATRYRVLRRSILSSIVFVGVLSALLVIPQIRALAAGILASGAVIGLVLGFAAQRTIGNFIAGLLIAFTQPVRLGDEIELDGTRGVIEEIGLTYTWVKTRNNDRLVIPNEKLASETIRNFTIRDSQTLAEVTVQVPLSADLRAVVAALAGDSGEAYVTELRAEATIAVRRWVTDERAAARTESDLRLEVVDHLRRLGLAGVGE